MDTYTSSCNYVKESQTSKISAFIRTTQLFIISSDEHDPWSNHSNSLLHACIYLNSTFGIIFLYVQDIKKSNAAFIMTTYAATTLHLAPWNAAIMMTNQHDLFIEVWSMSSTTHQSLLFITGSTHTVSCVLDCITVFPLYFIVGCNWDPLTLTLGHCFVNMCPKTYIQQGHLHSALW